MTTDALRLRGLVKRYGARAVVDGVDLDVAVGECVGILGPNGAGKTTTLEIIQGLTEASEGEVTVLGLRQPHDRRAIQARIGVALQETRLHEKLTASETLELFSSFYPSGPDARALLARVDLEGAGGTLVGALSGGQRQRLALACALCGEPELVILDEPTTGLDPEARHRLWARVEELARESRAVLLTTHFMDEAERLCDRVLILDRGKVIAEGAPAALIARHVGAHLLEVEVGGELSIEAALAIEGVRVARAHGPVLRIGTDAPDAVLERLRAAVAAREARLARITIGAATLEDVFLTLAGRSLCDAP